YYKLSDLFTHDEIAVQDAVREWTLRRFLPVVESHAQAATFPLELIPELAELGVFGANLPEKYGCANLESTAYGLIMQELERGDSGLRSFVSVQSGLVMYPIYAFGSEAQRERFLPSLAKGELIGCFGLTEPDSGSDPASMKTHARKDGNDFILNGAKMWITNGSVAGIAIVWAKNDDDDDKPGTVRGFIVEKGMAGFTAPEMKNKWSLRASITSELVLQEVRVPRENMLPNIKGLKGPLSCLTQARYGIAWGAIGAATACYEAALNYSKTRIQFGKPIASFQLVQEKLVYMITEITKAQLLAWRLAKLKDEGKMTPQQVSMAKRNNVEIAVTIARMAREVLGASGITGEYPVMRHLMNLESVKTYEGTHDIHTLIIGADITGIDAFK
ncbi:MAG: acyl-CoA dehydrogenase family protein, partial [Rhizobacter sp.]|nr:acyl-CoA dehydrogenase family protein [Chlorobiales bacterium]